MGKIKKILENELVGGTQSTDVYPVTSIKAVYDEDNERLDNVLNRRGVINISLNYNSDHLVEELTLSEAISRVPVKDRILGFQGRYYSSSGWRTITFIGETLSDWTKVDKWVDILLVDERGVEGSFQNGAVISLFNSFEKGHYYSFDNSTNKIIKLNNSKIGGLKIQFSELKNYLGMYGIKYTPSTGSGDTYTAIYFADNDDNVVWYINNFTSDSVEIDVTSNEFAKAAYVYFSVPMAHADEICIGTNRFINTRKTNDVIVGSEDLISTGAVASVVGRVKLHNGSIQNQGNTNAVYTEYRPIDGKYVKLYTNRPNNENCKYLIGIVINSGDIAGSLNPNLNTIIKYIDYDNSPFSYGDAIDVSEYEKAKTFSFLLAEYNTVTGQPSPLRTESFDGYYIKCFSSEWDSLLDNIEKKISYNNEKITNSLFKGGATLAIFNGYLDGKYYTSTNGKLVLLSNSNICSCMFSIEDITGDGIKLDNIRYTPSPAAADTYTAIIFYDVNDNEVYRRNTLSGDGYMIVHLEDIPDSAIKFAIDIPKKHTGEVIITQNISQEDSKEEDVISRNNAQVPALTASCRYAKNGQNTRDFTLSLPADVHGDVVCLKNAINITNGISMIDALVCLGDCVPNVVELGNTYPQYWNNVIKDSSKPCYFVMGNHEKGTYLQILGNPTDEQLYTEFIKIMVDKGWLKQGEYEENKCYYYHDFAERKFRLIVIDEYELPFVIDDSIWEPVEYDSTAPNYVIGNTYSVQSKVNVPNYTLHSFMAKTQVTCDTYYGKNVPCYKYIRGTNYMSETQVNWLLDTLHSTPENYSVIIACHNPFSNKATNLQDKKFSQKNGWVKGQGRVSAIIEDYLADIINAFINRENYNATYTISPLYPEINGYSVQKDFSDVNSGVKFHSLVGGHVHQDCVWKHDTYNLYQITPICTNANYYAQSASADVRRRDSSKEDTLDVDALTIESFGENRIGLVRFGTLFTETGDRRDFEVINI